jgi:hypothetical protein
MQQRQLHGKETKEAMTPQRRTAVIHGETNSGYATAPREMPGPSPIAPRLPNPEGALPPLPEAIDDSEETAGLDDEAMARDAEATGAPGPVSPVPPQRRRLRNGCYLIRYVPQQPAAVFNAFHYDGTLRVQRTGSTTIASGDLYYHRILTPWPVGPVPAPGPIPIRPLPVIEPNPGAGIPIFARKAYRYYVRVTKILQTITLTKHFTLGFELHRFDQATQKWTNEGAFTALMGWKAAPAGYPSSANYLSGDVKNSSGSVVGTLTMGWVSSYLRRATIEIDRVGASESPLNNGSGVDWRDVFDLVGWDVKVVSSQADVVEPSGPGWSNAEMHAAMLARRDASNLEAEWRYHVLCVREIDVTPRGIMYDNGGTDSNNVPREGAGIASHWVIPNADPWGLVKGLRFGTATAPYFRTALHEIGHAMGLYHNTIDNGIMNTTDVIATNAMPPVQFPNNVQWSHAPDDQKRLRHLPDIWVRPGGIPFGASYSTAPVSPGDLQTEAHGLTLTVSPLLPAVPIGAPVRVSFTLTNTSSQPLPVPASLSLKDGFVKGKVVDPSGTIRTFRPIVLCVEGHELRALEPNDSMSHSLTLLRGAQGALFPMAGPHQVIVEVDWELDGFPVGVTGQTTVMVTPAVDADHADAALKILSTPDALLTLAIGGDHLPEGVAAIQAGVKDAALRPHYAAIEAKRVGRRFGKRKANLERAAELLEGPAVVSATEIRRAAQVVRDAGKDADSEPAKRLAKALQGKATDLGVDSETLRMVKSL